MTIFKATRLPDWERRFADYLAIPERSEFRWGFNDCGLWGFGGVEAMTGVHPAPQFVGAYDDRQGALLALRELGPGTLVKLMDSLFTRWKPGPGMAQPGDLIMAQGSIGFCMGGFGLHLLETGPEYGRLPRSEFQRAWKV